jgi:hypothetical protein
METLDLDLYCVMKGDRVGKEESNANQIGIPNLNNSSLGNIN